MLFRSSLGLTHEIGLDRHTGDRGDTLVIGLRGGQATAQRVPRQRGSGRVSAGAVQHTALEQGTDRVPARGILQIDVGDRVGGEDDARDRLTLVRIVRSGAVGGADGLPFPMKCL